MRAIGSLSELIFPVRCLGCSVLGIEICAACRASWSRHIYRSQGVVEGRHFPIYSAVRYSAVASKVILKSKEDALTVADNLIIASLGHALTYFQNEIGSGFLVPIPSRVSASRKRGIKYINKM
jgi:predicted amidophosphoribosyltransferase